MMWKANKIGLLNFWFYDDEEFDFYDGKLLLRGQNGSGKSVTMQSFIPLILDGNKSPKRLDTFGSMDKHIEYYLLGDKEEKEDSTGYLYMEFYNQEEDRYITIGMGLRAKRGKTTEFFGFSLKDGRRINKDFFLYKNKDGFTKTPLTKLELKASLGIENNFVETTKEYKKMVNDLLFKFPNIESYDEFINVLLQIRSPKLSKDYKPSKLMSILNEVLPPLADEDLMPLSDTIENLNQTKEKMENLGQQIKMIDNFIKVFHSYNESILFEKSTNFLKYQKNLDQANKEYQETQDKLQQLTQKIEELEKEQIKIDDEFQKAKIEKSNIDNHDLEEKSRRRFEIEKDLTELQKSISKESDLLEDLKQKQVALNTEIRKIEDKINSIEQEIQESMKDLLDLASEISFQTFIEILPLIFEGKTTFQYLESIITEQQKEIEEVKTLLETKENILLEQEEQQQEFDCLKKDYNNKEMKKNELLEEKEASIELLIKEIKQKNKDHQYLILLEEDLKEICTYLSDYTKENFLNAKAIYENVFKEKMMSLMEEKGDYQTKQKIEQEALEERRKQLEELKNQEEIALVEEDLKSITTQYLEQEKIPYLSFYQAVDFKDNISEEMANEIEEILYSSGLLGAKIIHEKDIPKLKKKNISYLVKSTKKKNNLTQYLKPVDSEIIDAKTIIDILESISIDSEDLVHIQKETYQFDFLKGSISENYESKYIGVLNRRKRHLEEIAKVEKEVKELETKTNSIKILIQKTEEKINKLKEEQEEFPKDESLIQMDNEIQKFDLELQFIFEKEQTIEEKIRTLQEKLESILKNLEIKRGAIPLNLESYKEASFTIANLIKEFYHLKSLSENKNHIKELLESKQSHYEDNIENYDEAVAHLSTTKEQEKKLNVELDVINKLLNTKEYQELSEKIRKLTEIIENYPEKIRLNSENRGNVNQNIINCVTRKEELEKEIQKKKTLLEISKSILKEEVELGYVIENESVSIALATKVCKELSAKVKEKEIVTNNYYKAFNEYHQYLMDYMIQDIPLFENREVLQNLDQEDIDEQELNKIWQEATRRDIIALYQGKKLNLYALKNSLTDAYEADKIYLNEQDRHLFEDILLRTVGGKIKEKIIEAKDWVKNINDIMKEKQENSNLSFYLEWKEKSQEALEEMNTKELVSIFMMPSSSVTEADTNRLIKHFRSKISRAEEFMQESRDSFFQMIFDILDYRNWFNFKIYYKKDGNERKELTDKIFSVFSGGEKAKTMYVPLFASISAKLGSAQKQAPRLIALDEAFAGVDDKNIEEMFAILKSFQLDYILTSQALWCDYSEVQDISICELIRPSNQTTIAVKRYRWNGKSREIIFHKQPWNI